jgi:toxin FitB
LIILDTNVVSEPLRSKPDANVLNWLDQQDIQTLYLTTITLAELSHGVAALPDGRRRKQLEAALEERILPLFADRLLAFDSAAAKAYPSIRLRADSTGRAIGTADCYIASIAAANDYTVATRDLAPFEAAGVAVVNPWAAAGP